MIKELETYTSLPESAKQVALALSILIDRLGTLPQADRDDLFELMTEWRKTDDHEGRRDIHRAMEEILAQVPIGVKTMPMPADGPLPGAAKSWAEHVGNEILELRKKESLSQEQLAEKAGLKQSHISRLENAQHTATHKTLTKIAQALGVTVGQIDPCTD